MQVPADTMEALDPPHICDVVRAYIAEGGVVVFVLEEESSGRRWQFEADSARLSEVVEGGDSAE